MQIKTRLNSKFKMTDLGQLSWYLGIQLECKNNTIKMNQSRYIEKILSKFDMADCKPHSTPCEMDIMKTNDKVNLIDSKPYHEIIGSLIYVCVCVCVCIYIYIYIYMCVCVYIYIYICMCVCVYIHIYICVCVYVYIYIYIYIL